jgi:glycosyltransferase involved in cell wall biosynthesis
MPTSPASARVALLVPDGEQPPALPGFAATTVRPGDARPGDRFALAVAVGTRGTPLFDAVDADRRVLWLTDMDDRRHPAGSAAARAALDTYTLPVAVVAVARWMADQLEVLRPAGAPPVLVARPGLGGAVAAAVAVHDGPLRVLAADGDADADARAAVAAMREPATLVAEDPDVWVGLPRVAGFPRAPLAAFAAGATAVLTPVTGADEYVVDGENALYTAWDDERGTSRLLDLLARDRALLSSLRERALATARAWPQDDGLGAALHEVMN